MKNMKLMGVYDRLCMALTEYEAAMDNADSDYDAGAELYKDIVEITNDFAEEIN